MMQCEALTRWGYGLLEQPRRCLVNAKPGHRFCGIHRKLSQRAIVSSVDGGWCVWCARPGRRYESTNDQLPIALCDTCARALAERITIELRRAS